MHCYTREPRRGCFCSRTSIQYVDKKITPIMFWHVKILTRQLTCGYTSPLASRVLAVPLRALRSGVFCCQEVTETTLPANALQWIGFKSTTKM